MWEFSLNLTSQNFDLAKQLFLSIKEFASHIGGVVTSHEEHGYISILIGIKNSLKGEYESFLCKLLTEVICNKFKDEFLAEKLILPRHDKIGLIAFKTALLNFDKDTDYYIVQRCLTFDKNLYLESFYDFKLAPLKNKWNELVNLANENRDYLISNESFIDLLKFLIDNLDICQEEVDIIEEDDGYKLFIDNDEDNYKDKTLNEESLISSIIGLSPQKINLYCQNCNRATNLLEKLFDNRINVKNLSRGELQHFKK